MPSPRPRSLTSTRKSSPKSTSRTPRFDFFALHWALERERQSRRLTWTQVAADIGVAAATLRRVREGGRMEADGVRAMVRWLGVAPETFVIGGGHAKLVVATPNRRFDTSALYAALDAKRERENLAWSEVASALGIPASAAMLTRLERRGRIEVNLMVAATAWAGVPIESLTYSPPKSASFRRAGKITV